MDINNKMNDTALRKSYWVFRNIIKHVPKKHLEGSDASFLNIQIEDTMRFLVSCITANWNENTQVFNPGRPHLNNIGDIFTVKDWLDSVNTAAFIDYDGNGYLMQGKQTSNIAISPSDITVFKLEIPKWATHVRWMNR